MSARSAKSPPAARPRVSAKSPRPNSKSAAVSERPLSSTRVASPPAVAPVDLAATLPALKDSSAKPTVQSRLSSLSEKFEGFTDELSLARSSQQAALQRSIDSLNARLSSLQTSLELESKARSQSMGAMQAWLKDQLEAMEKRIRTPINGKLADFDDRLVAFSDRFSSLESEVVQLKQQMPMMIDARIEGISTQFASINEQLAEIPAAALEREKVILQSLQAQQGDLKSLFLAEKSIVQKKFVQLNEEITGEQRIREISVSTLKSRLDEEFSTLKVALVKENSQREENEGEILSAVTIYSTALQDAIKIVAKQP